MAETALLSYQVWRRRERAGDGRYFTPAIVISGKFGSLNVHKIDVFCTPLTQSIKICKASDLMLPNLI